MIQMVNHLIGPPELYIVRLFHTPWCRWADIHDEISPHPLDSLDLNSVTPERYNEILRGMYAKIRMNPNIYPISMEEYGAMIALNDKVRIGATLPLEDRVIFEKAFFHTDSHSSKDISRTVVVYVRSTLKGRERFRLLFEKLPFKKKRDP